MSRFWTTPEVQVLREHYPTGGVRACLERLPGRDAPGIYARAAKNGIKRAGQRERRTWAPSEWVDAQIKRAYADGSNVRGAVAELARRIDRPRDWISRRAVQLGLVQPRYKPGPWSAEELAILEEHYTLSPRAIAARLRKAGYSRTETAVIVQRKRCGLRASDDPDRWCARQLADAMGVEVHKVLRWIERGMLKATRQGDEAPWAIHRRDVRAFLITHLGDWDHRRCEQLWLVEILAGSVGESGKLGRTAA